MLDGLQGTKEQLQVSSWPVATLLGKMNGWVET